MTLKSQYCTRILSVILSCVDAGVGVGVDAESKHPLLSVAQYLSTATVPNVPVLSWWKGATHFPVAQRMARDFLAVPASSVQCERENSKAKYVITDIRNRLSSQTVQATLCLKSWNVLLNEQDTGAVTLD